MLTNCFRFAPRDSVPGLISKICKYLKEHPGWSVEELKEVIGDIETSLALGEISYFTDQSINDLDITALYDVGYRFVFIGGGDVYSAMYALEESDGSVAANGVALGVTESEFNQLKSIVLALNNAAYTATNPPPYPVTKVNNRTGDVKLDLADVLGESTAQTMLMSEINFASTRLATWNAFYDYGYRVVGVLANDGSAITALYILGQNVGNHAPIPMVISSGGNVTSVNGDIGEVHTLRVDPADPGIPTEPPTPINADTLDGKDGEYYLSQRNLLDNGDFEIAQAGYNAYHGSTKYGADRWAIGENGTLTKNGEIKTLTSSNGYNSLTQILWNDNRQRGKTYTLAIELADGTIQTCSGTAPNDVAGETVVAETFFPNSCSMMLLTYPNGNFNARINAQATGSTISFKHVYMLEGSYTAENMPPHVPKGYIAELMECKRYFRFYKANLHTFTGFIISTGWVYMDIAFENDMVAAPDLLQPSGKMYVEHLSAATSTNGEMHSSYPGRARIKAQMTVPNSSAACITPMFDLMLSAELK